MAICAFCNTEVFRYQVVGGKDVCHQCERSVARAQLGTCFPFTTTSFGGKPVEVTSLNHYRELCRANGTVPVAFEYDERNCTSEHMIQERSNRIDRNIQAKRQRWREATGEMFRNLRGKGFSDITSFSRR